MDIFLTLPVSFLLPKDKLSLQKSKWHSDPNILNPNSCMQGIDCLTNNLLLLTSVSLFFLPSFPAIFFFLSFWRVIGDYFAKSIRNYSMISNLQITLIKMNQSSNPERVCFHFPFCYILGKIYESKNFPALDNW